ncbi:hypothetical protein HOK51_08905 [Candidatus Woesearchaeota archaeon]|jgi:hypothetical protein|nr:hypothetical protein [Candidatus Woesearchaeota archaeon]MBT6519947.1 hypothetical protein [Candidatus Woesearchaeota archaeon]MBT7367852.1 hypothetical protein [Candidatus Woesearchaeota archaeon]
MKRGLLALLIVVLFSLFSAPLAQGIEVIVPAFYVDIEPVRDEITLEEYAIFNVTVKNVQDFEDNFRIRPLEDLKWGFQTVPLTDYFSGKTIDSGEEATIVMYLKPAKNMDSGKYNIKLEIESEESDRLVTSVLKIGVGMPVIEGIYTPLTNFDIELNVPDRIDPRSKYTIDLHLVNNNALVLNDITVLFESDLIGSDQTSLDLGSNEDKTVQFAVQFPSDTKPNSGYAKVTVLYKDEKVFEESQNFNIVGYTPAFEKSINTSEFSGKTIRRVDIVSLSNVEKTEHIKLETSSWENFFTSSNPQAEVIEDEETGLMYYSWIVTLEPEESTQLEITTSYRPLYILAVFIIAGLILFYAFRNPIVAKKQIQAIRRSHGAVTHAKILVTVKNRGSKTLKDLKIVERVPKLFNVSSTFDGTLSPTRKYTHSKEGTVLEYKLDRMDPHEERIIKYEVSPSLHTVGEVTLKPTIITFKAKQNLQLKSTSNQLTLDGEPKL